MTQGTYAEEPTGVYKAILLEDMIETVRRIKKPYIDVYVVGLSGIAESASKITEVPPHPLCFVPEWFRTLPLKKDEEVLIYYNQNSLRYPVLYKPVAEFDSVMTQEKVKLPPGTGMPAAEETQSIMSLGNGFYLVTTEKYTTLTNGEQAVILAQEGLFVNAPQVYVTGGELTINGTVAPATPGPFCAVPNCLFTGAPHTGNKVSGT